MMVPGVIVLVRDNVIVAGQDPARADLFSGDRQFGRNVAQPMFVVKIDPIEVIVLEDIQHRVGVANVDNDVAGVDLTCEPLANY